MGTSSDGWSSRFPRLFEESYVDYAAARVAYFSGVAPQSLVSRLHVVAVTDAGAVVGTVSVMVTDGMGQCSHSPAVRSEGSLGYLLDPEHHGLGYATEMVRAALDLAFGELGLRRVTAGCFAGNVGSWRVMEKVGMRREQHGIRDSWHAELGWVDGYTYAVLADERR